MVSSLRKMAAKAATPKEKQKKNIVENSTTICRKTVTLLPDQMEYITAFIKKDSVDGRKTNLSEAIRIIINEHKRLTS